MAISSTNTLSGASDNTSGQDLYNDVIKNNSKLTFNDIGEFFPITNFNRDTSVLWNSLLPYRFLMVSASEDSGKGTFDPDDAPTTTTAYNIISGTGSGIPGATSSLIYTLPITPQNLSIQMPFASQTTVLSDGILVENNGIPLRHITISGTTGIVPFRKAADPSYDNSILGGIAGNTVRAISNVAGAAKQIGSALKANTPPEMYQTGYEQYHQLSEFLQLYALLAKKPENKNVRLAFDMAKDNITYLVTPKVFTLTRTADSPLEYKFTIQLEAWKRIKIAGYSPQEAASGLTNGIFSNISKIQAALKILDEVSDLIHSAINVINAIRADVKTLVNNIRETILILKDIAGVAKTLVDLPVDLLNDITGPILGAVNDVVSAWQQVIAAGNNFNNNASQAAKGIQNLAKQVSSNANATASLFATQTSSSVLSGLTSAGSPSGSRPGPSGGATNPVSATASIVSSILKNTSINAPFLKAVDLGLLNVPPNVQSKIDDEIARVRTYTRQDFANQKEYAKQFSRDLAVYMGAGDATTDQVNGYVSVNYPSSNRVPSRDEWNVLFAMQKYISVLNDLSRFELSGNNAISASFAYIGQLIQGTGINIDQSQSKIAVPVPYGKTIQDIAQQYTGSSDNASEIILLNGLKPPYIDENGTTQLFISNGNGNSFNITDGSLLYINQKVLLSSTTNPSFARNITNVQMLTANNWLITVDGSPNLGNLTTIQNAQIQYFGIGTVSSRNSIFIPASQPPTNVPERLKPLPYYFNDVDNLAAFTGVDIALGSNNDIIMDKHGNLGLVGGIANLQQALKLKFLTPKGSLRRHPSYGFPVVPGTPTSEINMQTLSTDISQLIGSDPRFGETQGLNIKLTGPVLAVSGGATVNLNNKLLPFSLVVTP